MSSRKHFIHEINNQLRNPNLTQNERNILTNFLLELEQDPQNEEWILNRIKGFLQKLQNQQQLQNQQHQQNQLQNQMTETAIKNQKAVATEAEKEALKAAAKAKAKADKEEALKAAAKAKADKEEALKAAEAGNKRKSQRPIGGYRLPEGLPEGLPEYLPELKKIRQYDIFKDNSKDVDRNTAKYNNRINDQLEKLLGNKNKSNFNLLSNLSNDAQIKRVGIDYPKICIICGQPIIGTPHAEHIFPYFTNAAFLGLPMHNPNSPYLTHETRDLSQVGMGYAHPRCNLQKSNKKLWASIIIPSITRYDDGRISFKPWGLLSREDRSYDWVRTIHPNDGVVMYHSTLDNIIRALNYVIPNLRNMDINFLRNYAIDDFFTNPNVSNHIRQIIAHYIASILTLGVYHEFNNDEINLLNNQSIRNAIQNALGRFYKPPPDGGNKFGSGGYLQKLKKDLKRLQFA